MKVTRFHATDDGESDSTSIPATSSELPASSATEIHRSEDGSPRVTFASKSIVAGASFEPCR